MNKKSRTNVLIVGAVLRPKMKREHISFYSIFTLTPIPGHVLHFLDTLVHFTILLQDPTGQTHVDIVARTSHAPGQNPEDRRQQMKTGKCG